MIDILNFLDRSPRACWPGWSGRCASGSYLVVMQPTAGRAARGRGRALEPHQPGPGHPPGPRHGRALVHRPRPRPHRARPRPAAPLASRARGPRLLGHAAAARSRRPQALVTIIKKVFRYSSISLGDDQLALTNGEISLRRIGSRRYVSAQLGHDGGHRIASGLIDVTVPNAARAFDFLYGGQDNFAADRKAATVLVESAPSIAAAPAAARAFRRRVVRHLAADAGIRQFLEVGDGMVPAANTHEVAQAVDPGCRIVYVEGDPMMADRTRATLASAPGGLVACRRGGRRGRQRHRLGRGIVRCVASGPGRVRGPGPYRRSSRRVGAGRRRDPGPWPADRGPAAVHPRPRALGGRGGQGGGGADGLRAVGQLSGDAPPGQRPRPGPWQRPQAVERGRRPSRSCSVPRPRSAPW